MKYLVLLVVIAVAVGIWRSRRAPDAAARKERLDTLLRSYGAEFSRADVFEAMSARLVELAEFSDDLGQRTGRTELADHARMYLSDAERVATFA